MKWNQLCDGQLMILQEAFLYINADDFNPYQYRTRAEIEALINVVHPAGTVFTVNLEDQIMTADNGNIGMEPGDTIIDDKMWLPVID